MANINYYPGHMAKTKKQIIEDLKLIDVIIEVLDARIPISSQNPDIQEIIKNKSKIIVLNKSDLASEMENKRWVAYFEKQGTFAVLVDAVSGKGIENVLKAVEKIYDGEKYNAKGRIGKTIRVMVLGIPNVGKSSLINRMAKKVYAQVGNKPGVTKQKQWIKVSNKIELLDTPGVLWPKLSSEEISFNLAFTGTIKEELLPTVEIGYELLKKLIKNYKSNIIERYKLEEKINEILENKFIENENSEDNVLENEKIIEIMNLIGIKRGALVRNGEVDLEKVANILLEDFRKGKLGRITLEKV